jgi:uncharacterized membrane protein
VTTEDHLALVSLRRQLLAVGLPVLVAMAALAAYGWLTLPEGAAVPVHWDAAGRVDGYASPAFGLLHTPVLFAGLLGLFTWLPSLEPRRRHLLASRGPYLRAFVVLAVLMLLVHGLIVATALGMEPSVERILPAALGGVLVVIGNDFGKVRSNFFFGVRTPWTLSSDYAWRRTHRLAGRVFVGLGLLMMLTPLLPDPGTAFVAATGGLLAGVAGVIAYSWHAWRTDPDR